MPVTLGTQGQPDFNQPLELLKDCHRRIEHFINVLIRIVDETRGRALPDEHRRALEAALTYFATAAPRHTRDEEDSLFPRMRASNDSELHHAQKRIAALEADHVRATSAHEKVEAIGRTWLDEGELTADMLDDLRKTLLELRQSYQRHIRIEDEDILPLAGRLLSASELAAIGREMRERRR